jgi:hypothetical protein
VPEDAVAEDGVTDGAPAAPEADAVTTKPQDKTGEDAEEDSK